MSQVNTVSKSEECSFLIKLKEIQNRKRPRERFAYDEEEHLRFIRKQRQDLCRLFRGIPEDHPSRETVLDAIKKVLDKNGKDGLLVWYNSGFSAREIWEYAAKLLKEKYQHEVG